MYSYLNSKFLANFSSIYPFYKLYPIATCRYGIEILLRSLLINQKLNNKEAYVILPSYTCQVVENAILASGCIPYYCDITSSDWSISANDYKKVLKEFSKQNKKIIAFIMQHTYGITPKDRNKIISISETFSIKVIEDIAHCSPLKSYYSKVLQNTTAIVGSFQCSKSLSAFQGGMMGVSKKEKELSKIIEKILDKENQFLSTKLAFSQLIDFLMHKLGYPFNSLRKIRSLISKMYKGMEIYEKKLDLKRYKRDFFRRGKANIFTIFFINLSFSNLITFNKIRRRLIDLYIKKFPINKLIENQIKEGNLLLLWPIVDDYSKSKISNNMDKRFLSNWFDPIIFPNSSTVKLEKKGKYPNSEKLSKNCVSFYTLMNKNDEENIIKIVKDHR